MRIAHVTPVLPPYRGGIGSVADTYGEGLAQTGHDVAVFAPRSRSGERGAPRAYTRALLRPLFAYGNGAILPSLLWKLRGFDVIHLHYPFYGSAVLSVLAAKLTSTPLIVTYHMRTKADGWLGAVFTWYRKLVEPFVLRAAQVVLVSSFEYAQSVELNHPNIVELPFGVDTKRFFPGEPTDETLNILFVGGLDEAHYFKGVDVLLRACARLPAKRDWHLVIIGDGSLRPSFEQQAKGLFRDERVTFVGRVSDADLPMWYRRSAMHLLPAIDRSEAFGLVTLEAAASGSPSIVSNLPGVRRLVEQRQTGFVVPPGDEEALATTIEWLLRHPQEREAFGDAARKRAEMMYDHDQLINRLQEIYETRKVEEE